MIDTALIDPNTLSGTELLLRQQFAKETLSTSIPTKKLLQASVSASSGEALHTHQQPNITPPAGSQKAVYKSASGRTGVVTILMDSSKYSDGVITKACNEFNAMHPETMNNSYQLPCAYEGIPAGSWVYIEFEEI